MIISLAVLCASLAVLCTYYISKSYLNVNLISQLWITGCQVTDRGGQVMNFGIKVTDRRCQVMDCGGQVTDQRSSY